MHVIWILDLGKICGTLPEGEYHVLYKKYGRYLNRRHSRGLINREVRSSADYDG